MAKICLHCLVTGRVQGVFYRNGARRKATELNLTGWVKNRDDGHVEVLACGDENNALVMLAWLEEGPRQARVTKVLYERRPFEQYERFDIIF